MPEAYGAPGVGHPLLLPLAHVVETLLSASIHKSTQELTLHSLLIFLSRNVKL